MYFSEKLNDKSLESNNGASSITKLKIKSRLITLNVRGVEFMVPVHQFKILPESRLGKLGALIENLKSGTESFADLCDKHDLKTGEFYFDKDPYVLNMILNFYC